jgi:hypothetical protein
MTLFRRHLRLWVAACLAFQVVSLSAFVPRDCCAAHRPPAQEQAGDAACHHPQQAPEPEPECSLRGGCNGPLSILGALLSPHAVLVEPTNIQSVALAAVTPLRSLEQPIARTTPPDAPPPRS